MTSDGNARWLDHVPEGWRTLLERLLEDLATLDPNLTILQAKQKFGELRVYLEGATREALDLIDAATAASKQTCEVCGALGELRNLDGYFTTRCESHTEGSMPVTKKPTVRMRVFEGKVEVFDDKKPT